MQRLGLAAAVLIGGILAAGSGFAPPQQTGLPTETPPPLPTLPNPAGTPGVIPTLADELPLFSTGITVSEEDKFFRWQGFPGPAQMEDGHSGSHRIAKNQFAKTTVEAFWYIRPERSGYYDVFAYIPPAQRATTEATYTLLHNDTLSDPVTINQRDARGWTALGTYY
ncbi:MAG: hypothetical protein ACFB51_00280, partial [Anaerolineae bacterium]